MKNKRKIIILCVLIAIAVGALIFAISARAVWDKKPDEIAEASATEMEIGEYAEDISGGITALDYIGGDDSGISIMPLAAASPSLQLTKNNHATNISSGSYVNGNFGAIMYDATFIRMMEVDGSTYDYTPSADRLTFYRSVNGYYSLWACTKNWLGVVKKSSEYLVALDTIKPVMTAYANNSTVTNNSTVKHTITYSATDGFSGVANYYFSLNGGAYVNGGSSAILSADGVYKLYCTDKAGNSSDVINVTKDATAPTIRAYNGSSASTISSGSITTASSVRFDATDNVTGVDGIYIRSPGVSYYTMYAGTSVTLTQEGTYYYYAKDKAGNQSSTYSVTVDRTAPSVQLYSGTTAVSTNYYSAASYIRCTATDANSYTLYMRKSTSSSYSAYTSGTNITAEGLYYFYARDAAGNTSSTYTITLDRTAPVGTLRAGTTAVSSGYTTNASYVTYTATDSYALNYLYVRKPGATSYTTFASGTQFTADGRYYFYATDKSGNASSTVNILLDRTKPPLTIYAGTSTVASGSYTNKSSVSFAATDATSGVYTMHVRLPNTTTYIPYTSGTPYNGEGTYYFYAYDNAYNYADTVSVTLDKGVPIGALSTKGAGAASGTYTNAAFSYSAIDSISGVSKCEVKRPGGAWETYTLGATVTTAGADGWYSFRAIDRAGNVSAESKICLIKTPPTVTIYAGNAVIPSGSITNKSYVSFFGSGAVDGVKALYIKTPDANSYTSYAAGTQMYREGTYYFYAVDHAGNVSSTVNIMLDTSKPVGSITADGETVLSGGYVNQGFSYTATDSVSGVLYCEIKCLNGEWESYDGNEISSGSGDGWYAFRAVDSAGNVSDESRVYLLTAAPDTTIYAESTPVPSGSYTNKGYISFAASAESDVTDMYVKLPDASGFIPYVSGTPQYGEGTYYFYAVDSAGNVSSTVSVTLDKSKPVGVISVSGEAVTDGNYTNKAFRYLADDEVSGVTRYELKRPDGTWSGYDGGAVATVSGDGLYSFRAVDLAGNVSAESVINLLTVKPTVQLYVDEQPVNNGAYTNKARISMSASGGTAVTCYVKVPDGEGHVSYNQYYTYSAVGRYEFYAMDAAGNVSEVSVIVIDRTAMTVILNGVTDGKAEGEVTIDWTDDGTDYFAPIVSVTVNGFAYIKGSTIQTIDGGVYFIESTDAAGNKWTTDFTATRTEILSETLNKQYFETKDGNGNTYAFATFENAATFAAARESALVKTGTWSSETWDGGIPMDSIDSVNAVNGTYYIYKKSGDPNTMVAYFTTERLNAVIAEYAKESVTAYWWWQKVPVEIYDGDDLYALTLDKIFIGSSVTFSEHANYLIDGEPYLGLTYEVKGEHILTVCDEYGNSYEYVLIIVHTAPDVLYSLNGGVWNTANGERQYAMKEAVKLSIADENGGDFAMYVVKNSEGETIAIVSYGEEYCLNKSGRYTVQAINHYGQSSEIRFILSLQPPTVELTDNAETKRLEVSITASVDSGTALESVKIFRSIDGGETWEQLEMDDYGRVIGTDKLFYEFSLDGLYKVVVTDNFRSGIDAVTLTQDYIKPAPEGTLDGVVDGGSTNSAVRFTWTDEAVATLTHNGGEVSEYVSGTEITAEGEYELTFTDTNSYSKTYTFTIDLTAPEGELTGADNGGLTNGIVTLDFYNGDVTTALYLNGELVGEYESGKEISEDGEYRITLTDAAGNSTEYTFTIDTVKPTADLSGVENGNQTGDSVSLKNPNKACSVTATKDGAEFAYSFGDLIVQEGAYKITLTDAAGNVTVYEFEIVYAVNAAGTVVIIIVIVAVFGGIGVVWFMRKRKVFKKK